MTCIFVEFVRESDPRCINLRMKWQYKRSSYRQELKTRSANNKLLGDVNHFSIRYSVDAECNVL